MALTAGFAAGSILPAYAQSDWPTRPLRPILLRAGGQRRAAGESCGKRKRAAAGEVHGAVSRLEKAQR